MMLGPLTNLALALKTDPDLAQDIQELVIMGGNVNSVGNVAKCAEFNFHCDPEAAYAVLDCVKTKTLIVPWELCFIHAKIEQVNH